MGLSRNPHEVYGGPRHRAVAAALCAGLAVLLGGCPRDAPQIRCGPEASQCLKLVSRGEVDGRDDRRYAMRFESECAQPIDVKVCFEDERNGADCRVHTAVEPGGRFVESKSLKYLGLGLRYFARFTDNARTCPFPENRRVRF